MPIQYWDLLTLPSSYCGEFDAPFYRSSREWGKSPVVKTAQWAERRRNPNVYVPPTPFSAYTRETRLPLEAYRIQGTWCIGQRPFGITTDGIYAEDTAMAATLRNRALIRAREQLKSQNVNLSVAYAERAKTSNLVASSAMTIARAGRELKRGNFGGAADALGLGKGLKAKAVGLSDRWLELQYGWKPVLNDMYGSMVALHEKDQFTPDRYRITVRGSAKEIRKFVLNTSVDYGVWGKGPGDISLQSHNKSVNVRLDYVQSNPALAQGNALGITDPLSVAWELVPFSFVADWFVPVGSYLNAMGASVGYSFVGGYSTYHQTGTVNVYSCGPGGNAYHAPAPWSLHYLASPGSFSSKYVRRIPYSSDPTPRFPGFKNPVSTGHVMNAIALVTSIFGGSSKVR